MMQNTKIELYRWPINKFNPTDYLDIDWPIIHKECGLDHIQWIETQDKSKCQMTLELQNNQRSLIVEFFDKTLERTYHLMWAK